MSDQTERGYLPPIDESHGWSSEPKGPSELPAPAGSAARVTISRPTSGDGESRINIEAEWQGNALRIEMTLEDFALAITGRGALPATVKRWRQNSDYPTGSHNAKREQ